MSNKTFKNYRDESKGNYGVWLDSDENISSDQLRTGALLRIADSTEKMAANYTALQSDRDYYKRRLESVQADNKHLYKQLSGLRGEITKLKKKLASK